MNADAFKKLVNDDVREVADPKDSAWLREPEQLDKWQAALLEIKFSIEKQFANHKAEISRNRQQMPSQEEWIRFMAEKDRWKAATVRLLNGVNLRLVEVRSLRRERSNSNLYAKIVEHYHAVQNGEDPDEADERLWKAVCLSG